MKIRPEPYESIDSALRRLAKAIGRDGLMQALRRHAAFTPKSERRKDKAERAARRRTR